MVDSAAYPLQGASAVSVTTRAGVVGHLVARDRAVALLPLRRLPLGGGSLARGTLILGEPALLTLS
ncbi:MAG: hypothetical protein ABSC13_04400 [Dehalococcoidia bacterium]